jgi:dihydrofolate reductase
MSFLNLSALISMEGACMRPCYSGETAGTNAQLPEVYAEFARLWRAADKIVYSTTLERVSSEKTRLERSFDTGEIRKLKQNAKADIGIDGPHLAAQAIAAGLVDEFHLIICPVLVGGGKRFFPEDVEAKLTLEGERKFDNGVIVLRYSVVP